MGQQQLLLLVLGIVIVGLAVVVGIQAFSENMKKANSDALVNDAIRIASDIQAWKLKPAAFGGGAGADFDDVTWAQLGYTVNASSNYENMNGVFQLITTTEGQVSIQANSLTDSGNNNQVLVVVDGTTPTDIETTVSTVSDAS